MAIAEFSWGNSKKQTTLIGVNGVRLKLNDEILISNIRWFIIFVVQF
jgi:hypothetical protein